MSIEFKRHGYIDISGKAEQVEIMYYLNERYGLSTKRFDRFIRTQRKAGKLDTTIQINDAVIYIYLKHREMWFSICPAEQWLDDVDWKWSK